MIDSRHLGRRVPPPLWFLLLLTGLSAFFALSQVALQPFSHDEHQFVAGADLVMRGLLPYRSFPFHHVPNQIYMQGLLGEVVPGKLLAARLLSGLSSLGTLLLLGVMTWEGLADLQRGARVALSLLAPSLLALSPLFLFTSGRAWNHDLPLFLTLLASYQVVRGGAADSRSLGWLVPGLFMGMAAGSRLSFVFAVPAFVLVAIARPGSRRARLTGFAAGIVIGLSPTLLLLALDPGGFWFGNFQYAVLNTEYRQLLDHGQGMSLLGKGRFFLLQVASKPLQAIVFGGWVVVGTREVLRVLPESRLRLTRLAFYSAIALGLLLGALAPTPAWPQYFYAPLPFVTLALALAIGSLICRMPVGLSGRLGWTAAGLITVALAVAMLPRVRQLVQPGTWVPGQSRLLGQMIGERIREGKVLTLAPTFPLEAGLDIDPRLVTGPFTWRVTPIMDASWAKQEGLLIPSEVAAGHYQGEIAAVLTGLESGNVGLVSDFSGTVEDPLDEFARGLGYQPVSLTGPELPTPAKLWQRPAR